MKFFAFQRQYIVSGLLAVLNVFSNLLASLIAASDWRFIAAFLAAGGIAALAYFFARPKVVDVIFQSPQSLRTPDDCMANARRGLILTMGLYQPHPASPAARLSAEQRLEAARGLDLTLLDLPHSTFGLAVEAISSHLARLEHCWLITAVSSAPDGRMSEAYLPLLEAYFTQNGGGLCHFHYGTRYNILLDDDALVTEKARDLTNRIFLEARVRFGLKDADLLCDFSGGIRSLSLGVILACLDGRRQVQYIGTHYDGLGRFSGETFPIILDYQVRVQDA